MDPTPYYEDEIDLRQLLQTLVDGWKVIAAITALAVAVAGVASFVLIPPTYQAQAYVATDPNQANSLMPSAGGSEAPQAANPGSYVTLASSPAFVQQIAQYLGLEGGSGAGVPPYTVRVADDQRTLIVEAKDHDARRAAVTANTVAAELVIRSGAMNADDLRRDIDQRIGAEQIHLQTLQKVASETPTTVTLKESLVSDPTFAAMVGDRLGIRSDQARGLTMQTEVINPVWQGLQEKIADSRATIQELQAQLARIDSALAKNEEFARAFRSQARTGDLTHSLSALNQAEFSSLTIASAAVVPSQPVAPRKALNMAVAAVLGMMVGVFAVFFLDFWRRPVSAGAEAPAGEGYRQAG